MDILKAFLPRLTGRQFLMIGIPAVVLGGGLVTGLAVLIILGATGATARPAPTQPIAYDHSLHAGDLGIPCEFCHRGTDTQAAATIPSVEQCMFCHSVVATDRDEIKKITTAFESNTPIEWMRVHRMPDHVRFTHEAHIKAKIECSTCHGPVEDMKTVKQVVNLNMGTCLACHRDTNGRSIGANNPHPISVDSAPMDCAICHK